MVNALVADWTEYPAYSLVINSEDHSSTISSHGRAQGGTRIFEVGGSEGQGGGIGGQTKIVVIGLLTEEN